MSKKYDPLRKFLFADPVLPLTLSFAQVEQILGSELPQSAYGRTQWWANEKRPTPTHEHSMSWLAAGLKAQPDLLHHRVTFSN